MRATMKPVKRNLFEIENARNMNADELAGTFVPTATFWRLLSAKNHIILGSRGSGKTALVKMLSLDHLAKFREARAEAAVAARDYIGIYLSTDVEWVGALKRPWQSEDEAAEFFQWRLNLSSCLALLRCMEVYISVFEQDPGKRARQERTITQILEKLWLKAPQSCTTLHSLRRRLEALEDEKYESIAVRRVVGGMAPLQETGLVFEQDLLRPLRRGISLISEALGVSEHTTWLLSIDEAEYLTEQHHRILNSCLRSHSGNLFLKITTMPYHHHTLETTLGVTLDVGHDFEYLYIDQDPVMSWQQGPVSTSGGFAETLFQKRAKLSGEKYRDLTLEKLLGESRLLSKKESRWTLDSDEMSLLRKYGSEKTIERAEALAGQPGKLANEVSRKLHSALILRDAVDTTKGRGELDLYSGSAMVVRCGDGNPRRLIRLYNTLLLEAKRELQSKGPAPLLSTRAQTRVLTTFSESLLSRTRSERECGAKLYRFLIRIGQYMRAALHELPLSTDQVSSIIFDGGASEEEWRLIRRAVGLGLLYPNAGANRTDPMPHMEGTFHLAYALAPYFRILPRRGKAQKLSLILSAVWSAEGEGFSQQQTFGFISDSLRSSNSEDEL